MNLRYKALGLVAALGLSLSVVAPAVAQFGGTSDTDNTVTVTLTEGGNFAVNFASNFTLPGGSTSAGSLKTTTVGSLTINYTDTLSYRDFSFVKKLKAGDFHAGSFSIPAQNLVVLKNYNPAQGRWGSGLNADGEPWGDIGDIGATGFPTYASPGCGDTVNTGPGYHSGPGGVGYQDWTIAYAAPNDLSAFRTIACGQEGPGTAGVSYDIGGNPIPGPTLGTTQKLDVELTIPAGQPAGVYVSTLTLDVVDNGSL